jgi:hypothetical protein
MSSCFSRSIFCNAGLVARNCPCVEIDLHGCLEKSARSEKTATCIKSPLAALEPSSLHDERMQLIDVRGAGCQKGIAENIQISVSPFVVLVFYSVRVRVPRLFWCCDCLVLRLRLVGYLSCPQRQRTVPVKHVCIEDCTDQSFEERRVPRNSATCDRAVAQIDSICCWRRRDARGRDAGLPRSGHLGRATKWHYEPLDPLLSLQPGAGRR